MSWSQTIKTDPEASFEEALESARAGAKSGLVDDAVRQRRDAIIDAQIEFVRSLGDVLDGPQFSGSITLSGHVDAKSTSVGISGSITEVIPHG